MAKKKSSKKRNKSVENTVFENSLPQNILPIGERVEEDKNIYILQSVYKEIHKFTQNKTTNESGGMLVGSIIEEFGKTNIIISGFVEAKYCEATPTTLKFTHETWEYCHKEIDKKHSGKKIVGWIHTHPNFGIFLSEYDKFIHNNFFSEDHQIAYVVDPIQNIEGFYFWINGKLERCKGFYVFDKTGVKISVSTEKADAENEKKESSSGAKNAVICILAVCVAFLFVSNIFMSGKINRLKVQQETIVQSIAYLQDEIDALKKLISDSVQKNVTQTDPADTTAGNPDTATTVSNSEATTNAAGATGTETTAAVSTDTTTTVLNSETTTNTAENK